MIYVALTVALFTLRFALQGQVRLSRQLYPLVLLFLFLFSAFRHEVGCDWSGYLNQYQIAGRMSFEQAWQDREAIWWAILWLQNEVGFPYPWINVLSSAVCFGGIHVLARRQPDPLGFLVLLFPVLLINMPMSGIRQGAAVGLLCIALVRMLDGRMLSFIFWVGVATSFHNSAMIFILLAPLVARRITRWHVLATVLLGIPGALVLAAGEAGQEASQRYIDSGVDAFGAVFRIGLLTLSGLGFFLFLRRPWQREWPGDYQFALIGSVGMIGLGGLLPVSSVIADRLGYYLIPLQAMIFARIPWLPGLPSRTLLTALPYLGLILFFTVWTLLSRHFQTCYLPYQSWLPGTP